VCFLRGASTRCRADVFLEPGADRTDIADAFGEDIYSQANERRLPATSNEQGVEKEYRKRPHVHHRVTRIEKRKTSNHQTAQPGATDNLGYPQRIREGSSFRSSEARCLSFIVRQGMKRQPQVFEVTLRERAANQIGVACFPDGCSDDPLRRFGSKTQWGHPKAKLIEGPFTPVLANDLVLRLVSPDVKRLIDRYSSCDGLSEWLPVTVVRSAVIRRYWALSFKRDVRPLDSKRTEWIVGPFPRTPVVRRTIAERYAIFAWSNRSYAFFASQAVTEALLADYSQWFQCEPIKIV